MGAQHWKDPDAILDFAVDWGAWLDDDTIVTATWVVPAGLTMTAESHTATTHTIWLSGGAARHSYAVTSRITTSGGRADDRTFNVNVAER